MLFTFSQTAKVLNCYGEIHSFKVVDITSSFPRTLQISPLNLEPKLDYVL